MKRKIYTNQKVLGDALKAVVDKYRKNQIDEKTLIKQINTLAENNKDKLFATANPDKVSFTIARKLGKIRISLLQKAGFEFAQPERIFLPDYYKRQRRKQAQNE